MPSTVFVLAALAAAIDPLAPRPNGPMPAPPTRVLIDNAVVHVAPGKTLDSADILIENGRIVRVAGTIEPGAARVVDAAGRHVYAGFIDAYVPVDAPAPRDGAPGTHWSSLVTPQRDALAGEGLPARDAETLRKLGFTAAGIAPSSGIFRGWGAVVSTAEPHDDPALGKPPVYKARASQHLGFERSGWSSGDYPTSHMGVISLMRQTFIDAAWRESRTNADWSCLDAINPDGLMIYDTGFELEALLSDKVAREFDHANVALVGSGTEFKRLDALADAGRAMIVPLVFPATPDVFTVGEADATSLEDLLSWEHAPSNARYLDEKGLAVSITTSKLPRSQKFWDNMEKAIDAGLASDKALAMVTTHPAELLGVADTLGTIEQGKAANLVIASGPLFGEPAAEDADDERDAEDGQILTVFIDGREHHIADAKDTRFDGVWTMRVVGTELDTTMTVDGKKVTTDAEGLKGKGRKVTVKGDRISVVIDYEGEEPGSVVLSGILGPDGVVRGTGVAPDQSAFEWTAARVEQDDKEEPADDAEKKDDDEAGEDADETPTAAPVGAPFAAYTVDAMPEQGTYLLTNATVWTQSDKGIVENGWVLIENGKVAGVGSGSPPSTGGQTFDCEGKHITPGLIDAHSHTGLFRLGVNESGQAVTAEVRIADSIDPGHINWYRQLAGGVTAANLLHGSANPIGGQSQTVKVRWGALKPEDMHFEDAKPGIKFALGENVKQSNWGDDNTTRYPQTRLGVETIIRDRFTKAREYAAAQGRSGNARSGSYFSTEAPANTRGVAGAPGPRDLELEILAEILAGERLIHCHSYRQDEILMLCRVAEDFGFKIGTFQHGLETYKVAEIVREHAIGASLFSDWWAYKVEVQDAIPAAGPINFEAGLLTSYNSDSDDLARRMNVEAGKALRYALDAGIDMTPQDALAFVTTNPAIQLGIGDRVGTIEVGKDADLAVWSGDPLSSMSRCERTFVDGRQLFSLEQDRAMRDTMQAERARLVGKIMAEGKPKPKPTDDDSEPGESEAEGAEPPTRRSMLARMYERALQDHIDHGPRPGDCGCNLLPRELMNLDR